MRAIIDSTNLTTADNVFYSLKRIDVMILDDKRLLIKIYYFLNNAFRSDSILSWCIASALPTSFQPKSHHKLSEGLVFMVFVFYDSTAYSLIIIKPLLLP